MLTVLDGHSRAEWPVARIDLLTGGAIRVIVTFFAAYCAYVFRTFKVRRRLVRPITTCRTRSRWASLFVMTNFFAECTDCALYLGAVILLCPFGSSAPLHFAHLCSGHAKLLEFRWSELPHALHRGLHSRAEWPVSPHVLHTRYGHVPLCWRCPDCAHNVQ